VVTSIRTAEAGTLTVTSASDSGPGSLREAIQLAANGDQIHFDPALAGTPILLTTGELVIDKRLTIAGLGRDLTVLDGNSSSRILKLATNAVLTVSKLTIRNGSQSGIVPPGDDGIVIAEGGGIYNAGDLTLDDVSVLGNSVTNRACETLPERCSNYQGYSIKGGGIHNTGMLHVNGSSISGNEATPWFSAWYAYGGGLYNSGKAFLKASRVSENLGFGDRYSGLDGTAVYNTGNAVLEDTDISNNELSNGAAITSRGELSVTRCSVIGNWGLTGGAISGAMVVKDSLIKSNSSGAGGGNIIEARVIVGSTIVGNSSEVDSIIAASDINNSTIVGNETFMRLGISGRVSNSTIVDNVNHSGFYGPCTFVEEITTMKNTIIARTQGSDETGQNIYCDCTNHLLSLGHNIIGDGKYCSGLMDGSIGDIVGVDLSSVLETNSSSGFLLSDNGGPTPTVALLPDSPAIDEIPLEACTSINNESISVDQRGTPRPQGTACDIGAFEFSQARDTLFWMQQCREKNSAEYSSDQIEQLFAAINKKSSAFPECASATCESLEPDSPRSSWKAKVIREFLAVWLNLISGRLTMGRPIDLAGLTSATTVGAAVAEIEAAVCNPVAPRQDLSHAKDIAEALNSGSDHK
jgi:hypothetical protein